MDNIMKHHVLLLALLALLGIATLLYATPWGAGIFFDSTIYIEAARNLLSGCGLSIPSGSGLNITSTNEELTPLTHFPPLFPALLAMIGILGIDPRDGARLLNALAFGANIFMVGLALDRCPRVSVWTSLFGSFLVLISADMLQIHSMAMTEPTFISFGLLGLILLDMYLENSRRRFLCGSAVAIALALLSRYAGVALVITAILGVMMSSHPFYRKIRDVLTFVVISCLPALLWMIRNSHVAGNLTNRELVFHPIKLDHIRTAWYTFQSWLLPVNSLGPFENIYFWLVALVCGALIICLLRRESPLYGIKITKPHLEPIPRLLLVFGLLYALFLIVSISFVDALTPLNSRILSPAYCPGIIVVLFISDKLLRHVRTSWCLSFACLAFSAAFVTFSLVKELGWVVETRRSGHGYTSRSWRDSETIQAVKKFSHRTRIYTNAPDAIYILADRLAYMVPAKVNPFTRVSNDQYLCQLSEIRDKAKNQCVSLVWFDTLPTSRSHLPSENELMERLPLSLIGRKADGSIYEIKQ